MPVTIEVNKMSVSHKGSTGISTAFPDVCKTPAPPAPPIPIPYPNIAMSSDTSDGSSTVKMDGNMIMIKGANMMVSTGDEAGALLGVVSSKIKGKAEFVNYSFDVKVDGKNVCRLADPTQQNMGSANGAAFFHAQPPVVVMGPQLDGCEKTKKKAEEQKSSKKTGWEKSGIDEAHKGPIQQVVDELHIIIYFRSSNHWCADKGWIAGKHKPKPHQILEAKTIDDASKDGKPPNVTEAQAWMDNPSNRRNWHGPPQLPRSASSLLGVVMSLESARKGSPLKGWGKDSNGHSYRGKWITGDYDLHDVLYEGNDCRRAAQDAESQFGKIKRALNKAMDWDGIQHGPQVQWKEKHVNMPKEHDAWLKADANTPVRKVQITPGRKLAVCDENITVVAPGTVLTLESPEDTKNALICCGCGNK